MMAQPLTAKIRRVDDTLRKLVERRSDHDDPAYALRTAESIDRWLDERIVLMRSRDGEPALVTTGERPG